MGYQTGYEKAVRKNSHSYGEYIDQIDFIEVAETQVGEEKLVDSIAKLFLSEYSDQLPQKNKRKIAYLKSKSLVRKNGKGYKNILRKFNREKGYRRAIKECIEKGYIRNIKLSVPWHPKIFTDEDKLTTLPWQHKYSVLYSGRKVFEFATEPYVRSKQNLSGTPNVDQAEDIGNLNSIIKTGYIEANSRHTTSKEQSEDFMNRTTSMGGSPRAWAIFLTTNVEYAASYASGMEGVDSEPVLELEVPSKFLMMPIGRSKNAKYLYAKNEKEYFSHFDSPEQFKQAQIQGFKTHRENEILFTKTLENTDYPVLPINYINGVWDRKRYKKPYFIPLENYINYLKKNFPEALPTEISSKSGKTQRNEFARSKKPSENKKDYILTLETSHHIVKEIGKRCSSIEDNLHTIKNGNGVESIDTNFVRHLKSLSHNLVYLLIYSKALIEHLEKYNSEPTSKVSLENLNRDLLNYNINKAKNVEEENERAQRKIKNQEQFNKQDQEIIKSYFQDYSRIKPVIGNEQELREFISLIAKKVTRNKQEFEEALSSIPWESEKKSAKIDIYKNTNLIDDWEDTIG